MWPRQRCRELTSDAEGRLTSQNAPPDAVSEGNAGDCNTEGSAGFLCPQDVRKRCMIATAVIIVLQALGIVCCCIFVRRRRHRKKQ